MLDFRKNNHIYPLAQVLKIYRHNLYPLLQLLVCVKWQNAILFIA